MTLGILTIIETFLYSLSLLLDRHRSLSGRKILLKIFVFSSCMLVILARNETIPPIVGLILTAQVVVHLHTTVSSMISSTSNISASLNAPMILAILTLILRAISQFSNSFVVYEDSISQYLSKTLFFIIYWQNFITKRPVSQNAVGAATVSPASQQIGRSRKKLNWKQLLDLNFNLKALLYLILVLFTLRMGNFFNRCREEQTDCIASSFTLPFASLFDDAFRFLRVSLALLTLMWYSTIPHWFLRRNGHFQEDSAFSLICQFGTGVAAMSCLSYWILQWIPDKYFGLTFDLNSFNPAWVVYLFVFFSLLAFLRNPMLTYYRQIDLGRARLGRFSDPVQAYKYMKSNWQQYFTEKAEEKTIFVHGAQSAYSAGFASLLWIFIWMVSLLLGDGISLQMICFSVVAVVALEFNQDSKLLVLERELVIAFFYKFSVRNLNQLLVYDINQSFNLIFRLIAGCDYFSFCRTLITFFLCFWTSCYVLVDTVGCCIHWCSRKFWPSICSGRLSYNSYQFILSIDLVLFAFTRCLVIIYKKVGFVWCSTFNVRRLW